MSYSGLPRTRSGMSLHPTPETNPPASENEGSAPPGSPSPDLDDRPAPPDLQRQLVAMMELLTRSMVKRERASPNVVAPSRVPEPKVKDPETFSGLRSGLNAFITECELVFELQPSRFPDERTKVSYMISLLRGMPLAAICPQLLMYPRPTMLDDHGLFIAYLRTNYGDPDERGTARRNLKSIVQTGSASAYFAEFQQYIAVLGWQDQDPIVYQAIDGLKANLKDEIACSGVQFETLADLISFIIPLDNRLFEREMELKKENKAKPNATRVPQPTFAASTTITTAPFTPRPSQPMVHRVQPSVPSDAATAGSAPRGPLTQSEKQRQRDNNLCLYCGEAGHQAMVCPRARGNRAPANRVAFEVPTSGNVQGSSK